MSDSEAEAAQVNYPEIFGFGRYQGRSWRDAVVEDDLRKWLQKLAESRFPETARMGGWYMEQLRGLEQELGAGRVGLVDYEDPRIGWLRVEIEKARSRLAELEGSTAVDRAAVTVLMARIFESLRDVYEKRDRLRLVVRYRAAYLDTLMKGSETEAELMMKAFDQEWSEAQGQYQETAADMGGKKLLTNEDREELVQLWRKLVKMFHPDRYAHDPAKQLIYHKLMAVINAAKASGDLERLREIGENPEVYMAENGFAELDLSDLIEVESLEGMLENLTELIKKIEGELEKFRESAEFILMEKVAVDESILGDVLRDRSGEAETEIEELEAESNRLESAKIELTGKGYEGINEFT